eukprot:COSAG03_NODE_397_length_8228_cov_7.191413_8_plen_109_part_00
MAFLANNIILLAVGLVTRVTLITTVRNTRYSQPDGPRLQARPRLLATNSRVLTCWLLATNRRALARNTHGRATCCNGVLAANLCTLRLRLAAILFGICTWLCVMLAPR